MLPADEETLVLARAVRRGDLAETEIPPASSSVPQSGETLRFGKRIDRLIGRGRISEQRILQLLREVRTDSVGTEATILPSRDAVKQDLGIDVTMLPGSPGSLDGIVTSAKTPSSPFHSSAAHQNDAADAGESGQTLDGSLVGYKGPPASSRFPVEHWDRYEFQKLLGQGGMGAVYKALDKRLGRTVALKFIRGSDEQMTQRFMQEARAQSRLDHTGICHVFEVGEVEGKAYIAMQFVDGESLDKAQPGMSLTQKVQVMRDVCLAMHHAHEKGVIHRDIKPSNIMVEKRPDGSLVPVVMDFGLAREAGEGHGLTESGAVMGTPAFMSPEQARGEARHLDRRSDVYSLGATLFDVLTGRAPFEDETVVSVILAVMNQEAPSLRSFDSALPVALETICARCLTKDKEQRYPTAQALAEDLTRFLNREKISAKKVSLSYRLMWRARQNKPAAALVLSLLVSVIGFAGYGLRARYVAQKQAELARQIAQDSKDIEWLVRTAYALPLHNVEREQQLVRTRMDQVESKLRSYGELGAGLGHYALGRGHLSLHEHKRARVHLDEALRLGEKGPELYAALGRVLGELYHEALLEARRAGEKTWVEQRQKELQRELLDPATTALQRALLRKSELTLDAPDYIEGLLAYYGGRFPEADQKAQAALATTPWLSEAAKLRGEIAQAQALAKISSGKHDEARALLGSAIGHLQQAADISRSDGLIYAALARAELDLAEVDRLQGKSPEAAFAAAKTAAERTITTLPSEASGYLETARVLYFSAKSLRFKDKGKSKADTYTEAIHYAQQAIDRSPKDFIAWDTMGNALVWRGTQEDAHNQNPEPSWQQAERALKQALALAPSSPWVQNDLGICYINWGNFLLAKGKDPRERYRQALPFAKRAVELDPKYLFAYSSIVGVMAQSSDYSLEHGQDFDDLITEAVRVTEQCGEGCAKYLTFQRNIAGLWLNQAGQTLRRGESPLPALTNARRHLAIVRTLDQKLYTECLFSRYADTFEAEWQLRSGVDPSARVDTALAAVETCKSFDAQAEDPLILEARLRLAKAAWQARQGPPDAAGLLLALAAATKAMALNPEKAESHHEKARAAYWLGTTLTGAAREARLQEGIAAVEQGLKANAESGILLAMQAVLQREQAKTEKDAAVAASLRAAAEQSWDKALAINPLLKQDYAALWQK